VLDPNWDVVPGPNLSATPVGQPYHSSSHTTRPATPLVQPHHSSSHTTHVVYPHVLPSPHMAEKMIQHLEARKVEIEVDEGSKGRRILN
jgi:hypothetical protein